MISDIERLRSFQGLRDFTDDELEILLSAAQRRLFPAGTTLFRQGARGASCFLVLWGELDILREEADGREHPLTTLSGGAFVGQIALVDRGPRSATVRAQTEAAALELTRETFESLLSARSLLALRFQEVIAVAGIRQHRAAMTRLAGLTAQRENATVDRGREDATLAYIQAAAAEWGMAIDELDTIEVVKDAGGPRTMRSR